MLRTGNILLTPSFAASSTSFFFLQYGCLKQFRHTYIRQRIQSATMFYIANSALNELPRQWKQPFKFHMRHLGRQRPAKLAFTQVGPAFGAKYSVVIVDRKGAFWRLRLFTVTLRKRVRRRKRPGSLRRGSSEQNGNRPVYPSAAAALEEENTVWKVS